MSLPPLADVEDLIVRLDTALDDDRIERASALLKDASASVRGYTGQEFTVGTTTAAILRSKSGIVRLPQRPVTAVTAVVDDLANTVLFTWDGLDRLNVSGNVVDSWAFEPWHGGLKSVRVTYTHGYATIPDDIIAVVCQIAARALGRAPEEGGIIQESIAGYSYSVGSTGAAGPFGMLADERAVLDRYAHPQIGSIPIGLP